MEGYRSLLLSTAIEYGPGHVSVDDRVLLETSKPHLRLDHMVTSKQFLHNTMSGWLEIKSDGLFEVVQGRAPISSFQILIQEVGKGAFISVVSSSGHGKHHGRRNSTYVVHVRTTRTPHLVSHTTNRRRESPMSLAAEHSSRHPGIC